MVCNTDFELQCGANRLLWSGSERLIYLIFVFTWQILRFQLAKAKPADLRVGEVR